MATPLITAVHHWYCPNCGATDTTSEERPHSRFHTCPKMHMMSSPMLLQGTSAKIEAREREDYIGDEKVQLFNGRPIMSIVTTRDDGQDAIVFAPMAVASAKEM